MVLCSSDEHSVLLAVFEVGKIVTGTPEEVLERTCKADGVERDAFLTGYYENEPLVVAFEVLNPRPLSADKTVASVFGEDYVPDSFEDAIRNAISIDGDSGTIAAIASAVAGAYYGIPNQITAKVSISLDRQLAETLRAFKRGFVS